MDSGFTEALITDSLSANMLAGPSKGTPNNFNLYLKALTFSTTVGYIVRNKWIPVFVDVEEGTYCINETKIKSVLLILAECD